MGILAIETSCDETAAAVLEQGLIRSNIVLSQKIHEIYGGVIPELASRFHCKHIYYIVQEALSKAYPERTLAEQLENISAIGVTHTPGLIGSLLVGVQFAKSLALGLNKPLIGVNHLYGHVYSNFLTHKNLTYPFLCLTVSGGHTQIVLVEKELDYLILGETIDDAAGEAFDKIGKLMGFPYPSGHLIDKYALGGNIYKFQFPIPKAPHFDYSFSGLKTAVLYFLKKQNPDFIEQNKADFCASIQHSIAKILWQKFEMVYEKYKIKNWCIAGGVSANSYLRNFFYDKAQLNQAHFFVPEWQFCTDNAAMIAYVAELKFKHKLYSSLNLEVAAKFSI